MKKLKRRHEHPQYWEALFLYQRANRHKNPKRLPKGMSVESALTIYRVIQYHGPPFLDFHFNYKAK